MKVYLKIHFRRDIETVACCDEGLLNKVFKEGKLEIEISNSFYGGDLIEMRQAVKILEHASYFNIVGENIINKVLEQKIIPKEGVRSINGVPMAMKMMF